MALTHHAFWSSGILTGNQTQYDRVDAYNKNRVANSIVHNAAISLSMSYPGYVKGKNLEQLRRGISAYAAHYKGGDGNSEAVSEAIDDIIVNGKSANLFSKEISAEVMRRLGG